MPASLLDSQFATLERPTADENAIMLSIEEPVEAVAARAAKAVSHLKTFKRNQ
jgi:gluconate kinase